MSVPTPDEIRRAISENEDEPEGAAHNARAEALVADAEATGDRPLLTEALFNLVTAYTYSSERDKAFVPFARLLRMWDEQPGDFDAQASHILHWIFKWVSSGMLDQPHIPLAAIEEWQTEMARRYHLAGYSERAVRSSEFSIAFHLGDRPRAERAHAAWLAADRDAMADCHACELRQQGSWARWCGDDEGALRLWAPVLAGTHTCVHEPHGVLAASLLPLVRLGRTDEARLHHIRGYRLARDMESMRATVAAHVEFCARTGNEPRGLEILAEQTAHWEPGGDPDTYLEWTVCAAVLTRRLVELGHGDRPVPGPALAPEGREWTASALLDHCTAEALDVAARFDRRNGTSEVGDSARTRMAGRPLLDRLPLGLSGRAALGPTAPVATAGSAAPAASAATAAGPRPPVPGGPDEPDELLALARGLSGTGHPGAPAAWARFGDAVDRTGVSLPPGERAELMDHRAMELARTDPDAAAGWFEEAAALYTAADQVGAAVACRARAVLAGAFAGRLAESLAPAEALCAEAVSLHAQGRAGTRHATAVLLTRARIRAGLLDEAGPDEASPDGTGPDGTGPDGTGTGAAATGQEAAAADALDAELAALIDFAAPDRAEPAVLARIADATESRGRLAERRGDTSRAAELFEEAVSLARTAGRPWDATGAELALSRVLLRQGRSGDAVRLLTAALDEPGRADTFSPAELARLHLSLADAYGAEGDAVDEAAGLLHASHWADHAGEGEGLGGWARLRLGGSHLAQGRYDEAAGTLEAVLPDLVAHHGAGDVLQARTWLGQALSALGEHRSAAEQYLLAADAAQRWSDQYPHARLAHLAADSLRAAQLHTEARSAYARAEELWRGLGERVAVVRLMRSRAWLSVAEHGAGTLPPDHRGAELMASALREAEDAVAAVPDGEEGAALRLELGRTHRQMAEILLAPTDGPPDKEADTPEQYALNTDGYERGIPHVDEAVTAFLACGPEGTHEATGAELLGAGMELDLGRHRAVTARTARVRAAYPEGTPDPDGTVAARLEEAGALGRAAAGQSGPG